MQFLIADTFTDSLTRLTADDQKAVKTSAFDLQLNPANPGLSFHKLDRARDKNFWSVRVGSDARIIVHRTADSLLLCYAAHHDAAYDWAERRRLETHPATGAAQLVEVRERVEEVVVPAYVEAAHRPFATVTEADLLACGVPPEWLLNVRLATEDGILELAEQLPAEAAEALLDLATGRQPHLPAVAAPASPFAHPDAQRRFRLISDADELERALDFPWDKWTIFLHPSQKEAVERDYNGPARVSGSAGTGKTVVALHRAAFLARANEDARVLLTTFSEPLSRALEQKIGRLLFHAPRVIERIEVYALDAIALRLYRLNFKAPELATPAVLAQAIAEASAAVDPHHFSPAFLLSEWSDVVDAWQLLTWEAYRDFQRLGRKTRLPEAQRALAWAIFERMRDALYARGLMTMATLYTRLAVHYGSGANLPFDYVVVDEAQDLSVPQLRFLAALSGHHLNALFFAGDLGQRIFQQPFSWKALGVDVRGRSRTLRVNYRTSHQIRSQADRLLGPELSDVDGNVEDRRGAISVFNGPEPTIQVLESQQAEIDAVARWLADRLAGGVQPDEIGLFVRSAAQLDRALAAAAAAGLQPANLDTTLPPPAGRVSVGTMHLAKGLEFRTVAVMACDDDVLPLQERIESAADESDLQDVYNTERHLLYVACTRARDHLLLTAVAPASEFLEDLRPA